MSGRYAPYRGGNDVAADSGGAVSTSYLVSRLSRENLWRKQTFALIAFVAHLLMAAGVPLVEGLIEHPRPDPRPHIEARNDSPCPPTHDELSCQICRVLGRMLGAPARPAATPDPNVTVYLASAPTQLRYPSSGAERVVNARDPPLA